MEKKSALTVAGIVFLLIAIAQSYRLFHHIPVIFGTTVVPLWASWIALAIALALAVWMFSSLCWCKCRCEKCEHACNKCTCKDSTPRTNGRDYPNV
jgi:hypothetical protein